MTDSDSINATAYLRCPKCRRLRSGPHVCNAGRGREKAALIAKSPLYMNPPDAEDRSKPSAGTARAQAAAREARLDAVERGVLYRRPDGKWKPGIEVDEGFRFCPEPPTGVVFACSKAGKTGDTEPRWYMAAKKGKSLEDGSLVWTHEDVWKGRRGYGSMGMKEIANAMRLSPFALGTDDDRRKARNVGKARRRAERSRP